MPVPPFIDQLGSQVIVSSTPRRIVSLVPSQTELLYDLGLDEEVVGITKFCIHPSAWQKSKTIIGGTKNFQFNTIDALSPDLVIGNKEENYKDGIERLREKYPVWMSDIVSLSDALKMIFLIGELTERELKAKSIIAAIQSSFASLIKQTQRKRVLYLIWRKPWMAAAGETFINTMLEEMGLENSLNAKSRYPELSEEDIQSLNPEIVFLSSEPYPFQEKHRIELQQILPSAKIMLVDGEMFSWYGSRLIKAPAYFNSLDVCS
jgi:ABC-type Fe3+-hydroxamate transport system substrate-binding protein